MRFDILGLAATLFALATANFAQAQTAPPAATRPTSWPCRFRPIPSRCATTVVVGSEQALALAEKRPEIANGQYVLGPLRVPALYVVALWLRSERRPEKLDRFVPVDPAPKPYQVNSLMEPQAFIGILRKLKQARVASGAGREPTTN